MRRLSLVALGLATAVSAQAAMVKFQLSPPGTDTAVGLSPSNEVPVVINSQGSGGGISGGILFDTASSAMQLAVGYGSAAGFSDLTGPAISVLIHGPAEAGTNAPSLLNLDQLNFPASNPTNGGIIFGSFQWPSNDIAALLSGQTYLNIYTAQNTNGEIRGQLIPVDERPVVACPTPAVVECGEPTTLTTLIADPEGDALEVVWAINGSIVETNFIPAREPGVPAMSQLIQVLPLGTNLVDVMITDIASNIVSCSTAIVVLDTKPPVIDLAVAEPGVLWPPNHKMVDVKVRAQVTDLCGTTTWKIIRVSCNERVNGKGDGNTSRDWAITGDHTLKLRAERSGKGDFRIYTITLQAKDGAGNLSTTKTVTVAVPKSQGNTQANDAKAKSKK